MAKRYPTGAKATKRVDEPKVAMSYRLVVFRRELVDGVNRAFGIRIRDAFPASGGRKRR